MGSFTRNGAKLTYRPRHRRSALGNLFEALAVVIVLLVFVFFWALLVASPWILLAVVLWALGVF